MRGRLSWGCLRSTPAAVAPGPTGLPQIIAQHLCCTAASLNKSNLHKLFLGHHPLAASLLPTFAHTTHLLANAVCKMQFSSAYQADHLSFQ